MHRQGRQVTPAGGRTEDRHCAEIFAFYTLPIYLPQEDWLLSLDPAIRHHASETMLQPPGFKAARFRRFRGTISHRTSVNTKTSKHQRPS